MIILFHMFCLFVNLNHFSAPESNMFLQYGRPAEDSFNVSCVAEGVYPEPRMALFYSRPDVKDKAAIKSAASCDTQIRSENKITFLLIALQFENSNPSLSPYFYIVHLNEKF